MNARLDQPISRRRRRRRSTRAIAAAHRRAARAPAAPTAIGCSSSRPTPPSRPNTCCCGIISASRSTLELEAQDRRLSAPHPGRAWRLAAVPRRRLRHEREREGLFRAQDDRRRHRRAAHGARARGDPARAAARRSSNVFTRILLALYGVVPWRARAGDAGRDHAAAALVSVPPDKMSYWARTVIVPLLVLQALKPRGAQSARRRASTSCSSSRRARSGRAPKAPHQKRSWFAVLPRHRRGAARGRAAASRSACAQRAIDKRGRLRHRAAQRRGRARRDLSRRWPIRVMMYDVLGYPPDHPRSRHRARARSTSCSSIKDDEAYCQPCVSPVWDTALAGHALLEAGERGGRRGRARGLDWLQPLQVLDVEGRLGGAAPERAAGRLGVPVRQPALSRSRRHRRRRHGDGPRAAAAATARYRRGDRARRANGSSACRAANGGWGAFDADNTYHYLNNIPFADHGALLDPPTEDVDGALRLDAGAARRDARRQPGRCARAHRLSARDAAAGRQLVRPLGHELHLRHLVGAVRAQRRRRRSRRRRWCARRPTG